MHYPFFLQMNDVWNAPFKVPGQNSTQKEVLSGMIQGTVLDPLLFLDFINDLPDVVKISDARLFVKTVSFTATLGMTKTQLQGLCATASLIKPLDAYQSIMLYKIQHCQEDIDHPKQQ